MEKHKKRIEIKRIYEGEQDTYNLTENKVYYYNKLSYIEIPWNKNSIKEESRKRALRIMYVWNNKEN